MIVETLEQVREILPSFNLRSTDTMASRLTDFLERAQQWVTETILGAQVIDRLDSGIEYGGGFTVVKTATKRVICELAYLTALAELDLQLSEAGFVVQSNERMSPASQQRTERLAASLRDRLNDDCDLLVATLIDDGHRDMVFDGWTASRQFTYLTQAFMPTMREMARHSPSMPVTRWNEFHDLQPRMAEALHTTVASYVSADEVDRLLELYRDGELLEVHRKSLRWIRMAVMADINGHHDNAVHFAIQARCYMLRNKSDFTAFAASDQVNLPSPFNPGDGTVANFL